MPGCAGTASTLSWSGVARAVPGAVSGPAAPWTPRPGSPGRAAHPGSACSPSPGSLVPSAQSAPPAWRQLAAVLPWEDRSTASGPAAGASATASPASPADSSSPAWAAAGPGRRAPRDPPSPASAGGSAAAGRPPPGAAPAVRRPSTPPNVPAAPSSRSGGRTSGKASVPSQACNTVSHTISTVDKSAGQRLMYRFVTSQAAPWCRGVKLDQDQVAVEAGLAAARETGPGTTILRRR